MRQLFGYSEQLKLKMTAGDGKQRFTDVGTAETLQRLLQSVPSPKAEPIKLWLAKVGYEWMQELAEPALSLERLHAWGITTPEAANYACWHNA